MADGSSRGDSLPRCRRPRARRGTRAGATPSNVPAPGPNRRHEEDSMKRTVWLVTAIAVALGASITPARAQAPIESELVLITPVSKFIHDAALKAFADYAKEKWNIVVK